MVTTFVKETTHASSRLQFYSLRISVVKVITYVHSEELFNNVAKAQSTLCESLKTSISLPYGRLDKERENAAALKVLPDLLRELDCLAPRERLTAIIQARPGGPSLLPIQNMKPNQNEKSARLLAGYLKAFTGGW